MIRVIITTKLTDMPEEQIIPAIKNQLLNPGVAIIAITMRGKTVELDVKVGQ